MPHVLIEILSDQTANHKWQISCVNNILIYVSVNHGHKENETLKIKLNKSLVVLTQQFFPECLLIKNLASARYFF